MIFRTPSGYDRFRCIAGECKDNCCIGWEIEIDRKTAAAYAQVSGDFGERLRSCIEFGDSPCFRTDAHDRCPFLNKDDLCDIILRLGEASLCQICSDHPRYFEWFGSVKEGGLGLCCEAAAELILTTPFSLVETQIPDEDCELPDAVLLDCLTAVREEIFRILQDDTLSEGICRMLDLAKLMQERTDNGVFSLPEEIAQIPAERGDLPEILDFMQTLEAIGSDWHGALRAVCERLPEMEAVRRQFAEENPQVSEYLRNIALYFIWRYLLKGVFDGEYLSRVKLAAVSTAVIGCLYINHWQQHGTLTLTDCAEMAKNYSKEIEYSEENLNAMLDAAYELSAMGTGSLKGLFSGN